MRFGINKMWGSLMPKDMAEVNATLESPVDK
jgi:hypothetical protein